MAAWILYATAVALLLGGAAWILELALQRAAFPLRLIWAVALVASALIPLLAMGRTTVGEREPLFPSSTPAATQATAAPEPQSPPPASPQTAQAPTRPWAALAAWPALPRSLDPWMLRAWLLLSMITGALLLRSFLALHLARRRWERSRIDGRDVLVSQSVGPAVVGALSTAIVVPRWVAALPREERELVLRHEEEHIRAGDLRLLIAPLLLLVLFPWNAGLWCQLRRLRMAVEVDCDRRVVRRGDVRRYAGLLLDIGQRGAALRLGALALTHSTPLLERRIRIMTTPARPRRALAASLAALASIFVLTAWRLDPPPAATLTANAPELETTLEEAPRATAEQSTNEAPAPAVPGITGTAPPSNAAVANDVATRISDKPVDATEKSAEVRLGSVTGRVTDATSGAPLGSVQVYLAGDDMGTITRAAGQYTIADVPAGAYEIRAERIGLTLGRQEITVTEGAPIEVNFELSSQAIGLNEIRSNSREVGPIVTLTRSAPVRPAGPPRRPPETPTFTPHSVRPAIANLPEVWDAMAAAYARELGDRGVAFTVEVWLYVDANGDVQNVKLNRVMGGDSPSAPMSVATLLRLPEEIARMMRFTPAVNRDEPVAAWVAVPLTFAP